MSPVNTFEDFEIEEKQQQQKRSNGNVDPHLTTPSINDLNISTNFARKMEVKLGLGQGSGHVRLQEETFSGDRSRSVDIPVPVTPPSHPRMAEKKYWKLSFRIVLLPLILLGIPAHLALMKRRVKGRSEWIRSLVSLRNVPLSIFNILVLAMSIVVNVYVLKNIVQMFDILIIRGVLDAQVFLNLVNLVQNLPIIIPMMFIWVWGFVLRDLILSFTRPTLSDSFLQNPDLFQGPSPDLPGRFKLILMYFLITFIHTVHIYLYSAHAVNNTDDRDILPWLTHFLSYFIGPVFSTLLLPIYSTFCWACQRHYSILTRYVQTLIALRATPDVSYFNRFKLAFRELSDRVQVLNQLFALYFSWIIINVLLSMYVEAWDLIMAFFDSMEKYNKQAEQAQQNDGSSTSIPPPVYPPPELVRSLVGFLFIILLKVVLLLFTYWQAVRTNDMARALNIWLNDFLTEPNANVSVDNYNAFRLLKFYLRSRMQQPRPSLLRIPILACVPSLKSRLSPNSFVDQY